MNVPAKILVIDDEPGGLALVAHALRTAGFQVLEATDGQTGWEMARQEQPNLILLDVVLGPEDGVGLCRKMKADPSLAHTYIALVTEKRLSPEEAQEGLEAGAEEYFRRPADPQEFLARLNTLLRLQRTETALRAGEEHFRTILENLADGVFVHDRRGRITLVNHQACQNTGYSREELLGMTVADIDPSVASRKDRKSLWERLGMGETAEVRTTHRRKDGSEYEAEVRISAIKLGGNDRLLAVARDISERAESERALRENERRMATLLKNLPGAAFRCRNDRQWTMEFISDGIRAIAGYEPQALVGNRERAFGDLIHPQDQNDVWEKIQEAIRQDREYQIEYRIVDVHGETHFIWEAGTPVSGGDHDDVLLEGYLTDVTARHRTEEALRRSEERYRLLAENAQDVIWVMTLNGRFTYISPSVEQLSGFTPQEAMAIPLEKFVTPGSASTILNLLEAELAKPRSERAPRARLDVQQYTKDGSVLDVEVLAGFLYDDTGQVVGVQGTTRDISERRRAEMEGERSRAKLLEAQYLAGIGDFTWEIQTGEVRWSEGMYRLLNYDPGEALDLEDIQSRIHHPDDDRRIMRWLEEGIASGQDYPPATEYRLLDRDGEVVHVNTNVRIERENDEAVRIFGTCLDITDRKKAEEALRESEERYRAYTHHSPLGVFVFDEDGRYVEANPAACSMTGFSREELLDMSLSDLHPAPDPSLGSLPLDIQHLKETGSITTERPLRMRDGSRLLARLDAAALTGHRFMAICTDISEVRKLQEQLSQSQKLEAIGRLAGGIAHDFNNMLTVISNYSDLIFMSLPEQDPMREDVAEVKKAAGRAADLIQQLLAFSRKQIIHPIVMDVNDVIARCEKILRRLIGEDIQLVVSPDPELDQVVFDSGQMEQVLFNLAVNSRDAMPEGGTLTIETRNVTLDEAYTREHYYTAPGQYALLTVTDTGHGMEPEILKNVFEPFFTTKAMGEGTGLGMATVYGTVKQHGGSIEVYSEVGVGTTVEIYLPRASGPVEKIQERFAERPPRGDETILLVEDDKAVRDIAERILLKQGYKVLVAAGGPEAIRLAEDPDLDIDLVLTDVIMPTMTGKDCYERIQEIRPELKVLYMSGYTESAIGDKGILDDETDFIPKPFTLDRLARKVRDVLDD